jgi:hypothetical protein
MSVVHLSYGDVKVDDPSSPPFLEVHFKCSKTDPFRKGVVVYIGRSRADLCPVRAILDYMVRWGAGTGPFFQFEDGRFVTRERFVAALRQALAAAGLDCSAYAVHSFRRGAATTAAQVGIQDSLIQTLGRWQSAAYMLYLRTPRETLCAVANTLVGGGR